MPELDLYDLRNILKVIPRAWSSRPSVKPALANTLRSFCRRFCGEIKIDSYYEPFPFNTASELSGAGEGEFVEVVLSALGETPELFGASRLFSLVGLLASKLSAVESAEALSFGLDLFDDVLEDTDGDGPWSASLAPPPDVERAVAGYIWAALASPKAIVRWEAAHVVRGLCITRRETALSHLIEFAQGRPGGPFADARFHFYDLHGLQWLLIGLAHAASDCPSAVAPHAEFLTEAALNASHVLIREFAARAVLALGDQGVLEIDPEKRRSLATVNDPRYPPVARRSWEPDRRQPRSSQEDPEEDRYYFGIDIGSYWMKRLANCFGISQIDVERAARRVITVDWNISGGNRRSDDQRALHGMYRDSETTHSHGSYPRTDDLNFYLSYHAMMIVAGELLATRPPVHDPDYDVDSFAEWLARHGLSRADGNWLADRPDPTPLERPTWRDSKEEENWPWSLTRNDFDDVLKPSAGRMTLWGDWSVTDDARREEIVVRSALVRRNRSGSLLRALHAAEPSAWRLPSEGEDSEISVGGFDLKGWIARKHQDNRLDEYDPWGANITMPPPAPAAFIIDLMSLRSDPERRRWEVTDREDLVVLCSEVWGHYLERRDGDDPEHGTRLRASASFVSDFLNKVDRDLIVCVQIRRDFRDTSYRRRRDHGFEYLLPSARFFLAKPDGSVAAI